MAPTELLARQHHATIAPLAEAAGVRLALLTGRDGQKQKKETLAGPGRRLDPSRGRHACAGAGGCRVRRPRARRWSTSSIASACISAWRSPPKGHAVDLLVMTATPIPRTLMLAAYGDLDVSKLTEKPAGRQPIDTRTIPLERIGEVADGVGRQIARGRARLLGLSADRGIGGSRPRQCRGALRAARARAFPARSACCTAA